MLKLMFVWHRRGFLMVLPTGALSLSSLPMVRSICSVCGCLWVLFWRPGKQFHNSCLSSTVWTTWQPTSLQQGPSKINSVHHYIVVMTNSQPATQARRQPEAPRSHHQGASGHLLLCRWPVWESDFSPSCILAFVWHDANIIKSAVSHIGTNFRAFCLYSQG